VVKSVIVILFLIFLLWIGTRLLFGEHPATVSTPSKITLATMQLCRVQWTEPEDRWVEKATLKDLKRKKVIAVLFSDPTSENPLDWHTSWILTDLQLTQRILEALLNAKPSKYFTPSRKIQLVFEDNTGVRLDARINFQRKVIQGKFWESQELYQLYENYFGSVRMGKSPALPYEPGVRTIPTQKPYLVKKKPWESDKTKEKVINK